MSDNSIIFERDCRFSQLSIWDNQKKYYAAKGIDAWAYDVPSYVTCNPFIARQYAWTTICFIRDWTQSNLPATDQPFYIFELGSGTGQFSFYFLKNLVQFQEILSCQSIKIHYVMTDITASLFDFWKDHPALKPFVDSGLLDFAIQDINNDIDFTLQLSGNNITSSSINNPPIVIANYIFDSLSTDLFQVKDGKLYEVLVSLKTKSDNLVDGVFQDITKVQFDYQSKLVSEKYYQDEFDAVLFQYQTDLVDTYFQFPITLLTAMNKLKRLSNDRFLLISSDKGYSTLAELDHLEYPELTFHGNCFSTMVNYHALSQYAKLTQGDFQVQAFRDFIISGVFATGFSMKKLPMLNAAAFEMIDRFSPVDYFEVYKNVESNHPQATLEEMLSFLNLSNWDCRLFSEICDHLIELTEKANPDSLLFLLKNIHNITDNFYYFPNCTDVYFNIAILYQGVHDFEDAIIYYQKSIAIFGESDVVLFNIAMCYYSLDKKSGALDYLKRALAINPDLPQIKNMIDVIQGGS